MSEITKDTMNLHTDYSLSADIFINEFGHYYFRIIDSSNGSYYWLNSATLSKQEEHDLENERNNMYKISGKAGYGSG